MGGIGSQTFRWGPQVENVIALQVVTGRGTLVTCSHRERPDLFHTVRAGLGQFGIIFRTPFFRVPDSRHFFNFGLLRNALPPTQERADALIQANRRLFEQVTALGGKRYPIDAVPMRQHDWRHHFQPWWEVFVAAKQRFDPDHIFTSGQGIFEA